MREASCGREEAVLRDDVDVDEVTKDDDMPVRMWEVQGGRLVGYRERNARG